MQLKKIIKAVSATFAGLASVALASGCSVGTATDEDLAEVNESFTEINGGVCATHVQIAAEIVRTAMVDLGRYRPGLDLVKAPDGAVALTSSGSSRCNSRGGCPRLKSLLSYQHLNNMQVEALSSEFPFMHNLQTGGISNAIASSMSDSLNPNPNQVISHSLSFAYTKTAPPLANCGINLKYHCFSVSGLPSGKTATDLANNLNSLLSSNNEVHALTRIFVDSSNKLCIDPDGTGDDLTGGGSTGGSTCVDGTMAISYDPSFVGNCCTTASGTGFLVQNSIDGTYMSCKMKDLAAGKTASADSTLNGFPASNATDTDLVSMWKAGDTNANHWAKVDVGASTSVKGVVFKFEAAGAYGYKVETSPTGSVWTVKGTGTSAANATSQDVSFSMISTRYVRVTLTSLPAGKSGALSSVRVF
jgi:F5/8 type C domain